MSRRSLGGYLVPAITGLVCYKIIARTQNAARKASYKPKSAEPSISFVEAAAGHLANEGRESPEQQHQREEKSYWRWTKIAAMVAAIGAIVAAGFAGCAFQQAQRQADAAERANRPWLRIENATLNSTHTSNGKISLFYSLRIKNSGHEVAGRVFADINQPLSPDQAGVHFRDMAKFICDQTKLPEDYLGMVVFPDTDAFFPISKVINLPSDKGQRQNYSTELRGCLLYEDARHNRHSTSFSFILIGLNLDTPFEGWGGMNQWVNPPKSIEVPTYAD